MRTKNLKIELPKGERYKYETAEMMPNLCTQLLCVGAKGMGKTIAIVNLVKKLNFDNIRVEKVDVRNLSYKDNSFDIVHVYGILHHIIEVNDAVKEILRVLKPGGSMYAMFYNKNSLLYYHSIMYLRGVVEGEFEKGLTEEDLMSKYSEAKFGCPYTKIYTEDEVKELCKLTGFRQIETHIDAPHIDTLETRKVEISNLPKNMGWHITVKAMK